MRKATKHERPTTTRRQEAPQTEKGDNGKFTYLMSGRIPARFKPSQSDQDDARLLKPMSPADCLQ
ncbi:hypothetical protein PoB_006241400, partial [Plakobranchus ocellatus]